MFRQTKRKPKGRDALRRKEDDDDGEPDEAGVRVSTTKSQQDKDDHNTDNEEASPVIIRRLKEPKSFVSQKKRKESARSLKRGSSAVGRSSFRDDNDEEDDEGKYQKNGKDSGTRKRKKKKQREKAQTKGHRFEGMSTMVIDEDLNDTGMSDVQSGTYSTPRYGKEALAELKAAQSSEKPKELRKVEEQNLQQKQRNLGDEKPAEPSTSNKEKDYISLHEGSEVIDHDAPLIDEDTNKPIILEDLDDNGWEEQVARRAGVKSTDASTEAKPRRPVNALTLDMLRENLLGTVRHLSTREEDLGNAIMRREADLAQTRADRQRQKESIESSGTACGDYQRLRYELAMWVGALRDLEDKVEPIQKSLLEMVSYQFETAHHEWIHWQDDTCATLREYHRLDCVLGRQPPKISSEEIDNQVDEFGRDIGSQIRRDRENRCRRRKQKVEEILQGHDGDYELCILDYLWTREESTERQYDILQEALRVAIDDLDDDYSVPSNLKEVFEAWNKEYPDEYRQCYANLSLADLAHVFDEVDLCRSKWIRGLLKKDEDTRVKDSLCPTAITIPQDGEDMDTSSGAAMERAFGKQFIPFLLELLREHPSALFLSKEISELFCASIPGIITKMGLKSESSKSLCNAISNAVSWVLQSLSIPIVKPVEETLTENLQGLSKERFDDALLFANTEQARWIQGLLLTLLELWLPVLKQTSTLDYQNLGRSILAFLSETYLYFLSSLSGSQEATTHLAPIWKCLQLRHRELLGSPDLILQSAPLRAAASAYGFSHGIAE